MSITWFILNGFEVNPDFYKCSEDLTSRPVGVRRPFWGAYFFLSGVSILILYSICFFAIATSDLMRTPAYKTMFVLGIYDLFSTCMHSVATGILGYYGVAYCDYPRLNLIFGSIALGSWMGCCITSLTLAVIRICDVCPTLKVKKLFEGRRIYVFIFLFWAYGMYAAFLSKPVTFSSSYMSWFFDPQIGNNPSLYVNLAHTFNNGLMAVGTVILYGYLAYLSLQKSGTVGTGQLSKYQILLQAFFFCIFHLIGSILYVYMQFVSAPEFLVLISQLAWQFGTGMTTQA
ncbi:CBN-SRT-22 protein [Caenorhabditis brenneri]|uniref:CBN-SRT-22 protein n=1 Tax=Caenorhabditis brenneri TaxID=135651 RepID=G0MU80_CAEBE|nr:CBN-SRT-22 protein [Caenorhabditis brenneri]